ncbi:homoserine dehydrogenase [soil metagenome]
MAAPVRVGMLGCGTVGGGVLRLLDENARYLAERVGAPIEIAKIAIRDGTKARPYDRIRAELFTANADEVIDDGSVDVIVELMGGVEPARGYIERALDRKRSVVTANKALLAAFGPALLERAVKRGVDVAFEGAVGGGIPIVRVLRESLASDWVSSLTGIVNGTCNFVLTRMREDGLSFADALREAQEKGYAEADPELDVGGHDAAHKLVVLAMLAFGAKVDASAISVEGIRELEQADHAWADRFGYAIKHLAIGRDHGELIELRVHPTLVRKNTALANIGGVLNAVAIEGRALGPLLVSGRGAGALPTAVSVVSDLVDVARALRGGGAGNATRGIQMQARPLVPAREVATRCLLRLRVAEGPRSLSQIVGALADAGVASSQTVQEADEIALVTERCETHRLEQAFAAMTAANVLSKPPKRLRIVEDSSG